MLPRKVRLYAWSAGGLLMLFGTALVRRKLIGGTPYFERTDTWVTCGLVAALGLAIVVLGACLRELKPGPRFGRLRLHELLAAGAACALVVCTVVVSVVGRPEVAEVERALATGNVARARIVAEALRATVGGTKEVSEAEDLIDLAEASSAPLSAALELLDGVVQGGRTKAREAGVTARTRRLTELESQVQRRAGFQAIGLIELWFPETWKSDAEVAELRARAEEAELLNCETIACRLGAARRAGMAAATESRSQTAAAIRNDLLETLVFREQRLESTAAKLRRLRILSDTAAETLKIAADDTELAASAARLTQIAAEQRGKTALIGASEGVVAELIAPLTPQTEKVSVVLLVGVTVYAIFDKQRACRGVYAVGPSEGSRAIASSVWNPERILSQAVGRPASVRKPPSAVSVSRWAVAGIPVVARWRAGTIVELRIGEAAP
jgi:hypothetical protein